MLTVGNKAVVPDSGASQESSRIGKTKRFTSACGNLQIRKQSKQILSCKNEKCRSLQLNEVI